MRHNLRSRPCSGGSTGMMPGIINVPSPTAVADSSASFLRRECAVFSVGPPENSRSFSIESKDA